MTQRRKDLLRAVRNLERKGAQHSIWTGPSVGTWPNAVGAQNSVNCPTATRATSYWT